MTPSELLRELNEADEGRRIEAKRASQVGKSLMETVSAFSNTPGLGGGYLLLGVSRTQSDLFEARYVPEGVADPDKVSADLATQCASMLSERVRPEIQREEVAPGRVLVSAYVPEAPADRKPIYIESRGLPAGAFLRIGTTDQRCDDNDLAKLFQARSTRSFDGRLLDGTTEADASGTAVANYRRARKERDASAPELEYDDARLLRALRVVKPDDRGAYRFTVAGLLLFGTREALSEFFPMVRVDYIRVQGRTWLPSTEDRFTSLDLYGSIFDVVYRLEAAIMDDLPARFTLPEGSLHRVDVPRLPRKAVREALVNALMHRDYEVHEPIQVVRYSNRVEFRNAGYSLKPEEELGTEGSRLRNPVLASVLHQTRLAETKGSGIRAMRDQMREADLSPPTFFSDRGANRFVASLLMLHLLEPETLAWLAHFDALDLSREDRQALVFARETGRIRNEDYRNLNDVDTLKASASLGKLRDLGLLDQHDKGAATFYTPTARLLAPGETPEDAPLPRADDLTLGIDRQTGGDEGPIPQVGVSNPQVDAQIPPVGRQNPPVEVPPGADVSPDRARLLVELPPDLQSAVLALPRRADHRRLRGLVARVCAQRAWSARELGLLLDRKHRDLVRAHLSPMVQQGALTHTQAGRSARNQTYRTADATDDD